MNIEQNPQLQPQKPELPPRRVLLNKQALQKGSILAVVALLMTGSAGMGWWLASFSRNFKAEPIPAAATTNPITVQTAIATKRPLTGDRTLTGTVESIESVTLTTRIPGQIRELLVQEGSRVKTGQVIATIDVKDVEAQRRQAEAQIWEAQAAVTTAQAAHRSAIAQVNNYKASVSQAQAKLIEAQAQLADAKLNQQRIATLYSQGAVAKVNLDTANTRVSVIEAQIEQAKASVSQAEAAVNQADAGVGQAAATVRQASAKIPQAQAGVAQASANIDYGTVRAPFDGVVTRKFVEVGAMAGSGQPLVTLESGDRLRLSVAVPESLVNRLQLGQNVSVQIDALKRSVSGTVSQIIPAADPTSRNFTVKIALSPLTQEEGQERVVIPGMFGRLQLTSSDRTALTIPTTAVVKRLGIEGVFKVVDGKAQFQVVTLKPAQGDKGEVFSGLKEGDRIILNPNPMMLDGTVVN